MLTHPRQELYRMGILYNDQDNTAQDSESNTVSCDLPVERSVPVFVLRHGKPRRSRRRSTAWRSLPLYLSFSGLSDDSDIARLLSPPSTPYKSTIQHRITIRTPPITTDIPQSLPPTPLALASVSTSASRFDNDTLPISLVHDFPSGDWTFVTPSHPTADTPTPASEPENWILIDDS